MIRVYTGDAGTSSNYLVPLISEYIRTNLREPRPGSKTLPFEQTVRKKQHANAVISGQPKLICCSRRIDNPLLPRSNSPRNSLPDNKSIYASVDGYTYYTPPLFLVPSSHGRSLMTGTRDSSRASTLDAVTTGRKRKGREKKKRSGGKSKREKTRRCFGAARGGWEGPVTSRNGPRRRRIQRDDTALPSPGR